MPKPPIDGTMNLAHYQESLLVPQPAQPTVPKELQNARPASGSSGSSGWKIAGRVALGIVTGGTSELIRLAYRGLKALFSCCRSAPEREPRVAAHRAGLPHANPQNDYDNTALRNAFADKGPWPPQHKAALDALFNDLRAKYGKKLIPTEMKYTDILKSVPTEIDNSVMRDVFVAVRDAKQAVSPNELTQIVKRKLVPALNLMAITNAANKYVSTVGGLGGLNMPQIIVNIFKDPALKTKVKAAGSLAEAVDLANSIKLKDKLDGYRNALNNALDELRTKFGAGMLPEDMESALSVKDEDGSSVRSSLESKFNLGEPSVKPESLVETLKDKLAVPLQQRAVEEALTAKAKQMGVTLSRRSTVLLAESVVKQPGPRAALNKAANPQALKDTIEGLGLEELLRAQKAGVEKMYSAHAGKLAPEVQPLLRAFIEDCSFAPANAEATEHHVAEMAEHMKTWKNVKGTDEDRQPLNNVYKQNYAEDLSDLEDNGNDRTGYTDNIYNTTLMDANRNNFDINGTIVNGGLGGGAGRAITQAFKEAVPDARDQRFLTKLMNQRLWTNVVMLSSGGMLPNGLTRAQVPGCETFPQTIPGRRPVLVDPPLAEGKIASFKVTVAPDKKTAKVVCTAWNNVCHMDGRLIDGKIPNIGKIKFTMNFDLNLNANEEGQSVTSFRMDQEYFPDDRSMKA